MQEARGITDVEHTQIPGERGKDEGALAALIEVDRISAEAVYITNGGSRAACSFGLQLVVITITFIPS